MKVNVVIDNGIIGGEDKEFLESMFPSEVISFTQRKSYDEYYPKSNNPVDISLDQIKALSAYFGHIKLFVDEIIIKSH